LTTRAWASDDENERKMSETISAIMRHMSALIEQRESFRASQGPKARVKVGDKVRVNLHHGKIEDAIVRAVIQHTDGLKLQIDVVGLDLTALIDTRQVVE
jgi:transcription antitermination factor NusG